MLKLWHFWSFYCESFAIESSSLNVSFQYIRFCKYPRASRQAYFSSEPPSHHRVFARLGSRTWGNIHIVEPLPVGQLVWYYCFISMAASEAIRLFQSFLCNSSASSPALYYFNWDCCPLYHLQIEHIAFSLSFWNVALYSIFASLCDHDLEKKLRITATNLTSYRWKWLATQDFVTSGLKDLV